MDNTLRLYGEAPYAAALIHGGPGAPGSMAPVSRCLAGHGLCVIEPLQSKTTVRGQIDELADTICPHGPIILVGHSWGAWLACLTAAQYPGIVKKLILVSSGPFEAHYADSIMETRLRRLPPDQRGEAEDFLRAYNDGDTALTGESFAAFGALMDMADTYCPSEKTEEPDPIPCDMDAFSGVWTEAEEMRRSGELLNRAAEINCPVVAIHGDYDPHPYRGVKEPLAKALCDFRFILLEKCGHTPWEEHYAREAFFQILRDALHS